MVLSERERKRGPDTTDEHLSLHLLKQACERRCECVCALPLPSETGYSAAWMKMHTHHPHPPSPHHHRCSSLGGKCETPPLPPLPTHRRRAGRAAITHAPTTHVILWLSQQLMFLDANTTEGNNLARSLRSF